MTNKEEAFSILEQENRLIFCGEISIASGAALLKAIFAKQTSILDKNADKQEEAKITLELSVTCQGGDFWTMIHVYEELRISLKIPVHTTICGMCSYCGLLLSLIGSKRFITKNSFVKFSPLHIDVTGTTSHLESELENSKKHFKMYCGIFAEKFNIPDDDVSAFLQMEKKQDFTAQECVDKGIVHSIV